ncbi:putative mportin-alpha export receptor [Neurospora crassa]|uniref:Chromosome segregation protein Cse1 n=2 Tax=Neurospora crassa TaxID=5141 RepID=Q1K6V2_NEUCR|nr:chromosome segregation protein Cse1 [Neurospora crassa OR74A]EAA31630.1 chromosome segregation protein Cse1 [Neurospora crassa OR74A]KHE87419.1 putative mportin-alpha export receptor [Neurospora crassa]CAD71016.1 probable mportin-alpha export receptor [Neurospora crassa]|eukprot:XP_960866.1 chromosome segregation protein Cse1 [Neurospora crassa OR74A]
MAANLDHLAQLLQATLDARHHRKAETALKEEAKKPKYSLSLLSIVANDAQPSNIRLAAALAFKNFIRHNYVDEEGNYKLPADEVATIKQELVGLMISSPPTIQTQLGEAISIIADSDFWERWDTLTQDLVSRLSTTDPKVTNGVLEVAHSIFARWRPLFSSNALNIEVNHVVNTFGDSFIQMLGVADQQIEANKTNEKALKGWLETMSLLTRIFFDLSCQDLPPIIETNLQPITMVLHKYLSYANPLFDDEEDEATPIEILKSDICDALHLFVTKYDDDFGGYVQDFTSNVWNVLSSVGPQKRYDVLVSKALHFLTAVASVHRHAQIFNNEEILGTIVEKVILPNVTLRESDIELFEDEPIEFIRRDLEGSDTDSRRKAATDFLRKLLDDFEALVTQVVSKYINHYLEMGKTDWKAKDTAVYLFLAIAAKGAVTAAQGVKTVNSFVNVIDFFQQHIAADLVATGGEPIPKVDAIKFLYNFRSQLSKEQWGGAINPLIQNLASPNYVVYTYAATTLERVLFLTDDQGQHILSRADIQPYAKDLLQHLFALVEKDTSAAKLQENEFLMRCIMRVLIVIKDGVLECDIDNILDHLINITNVIKENPSNPRFYYFHFEAIGAIVRYCSNAPQVDLLSRLWAPFTYILNEDVTEFVPYVFQIFTQLLDLNKSGSIPGDFKALIDAVLAPGPWETRGNIPPLAKFIAAIIPKATEEIVKENKLEPILSIFQSLLNGKKTDQNAFDILESVICSFPASVLEPYFGTILTLIFTKLQKNPSDSYKTRVASFYHLVSARSGEAGLGTDYFIKHAETIQSGVFTPFYLQVVIPTTREFARPSDRKLAVISYSKTLVESKAFAERYMKGWGFTCNALLELLKNPPKVSAGAGDEILNEADVDDIGFGIGFTPLSTCKRPPRDEFPEITDVQQWVGDFLKASDKAHNGLITKYASERLNDEAKAVLAPILM